MKKDKSKQLEPTEKQKRSVRDTMRNLEIPHIGPAKAMNIEEIGEEIHTQLQEQLKIESALNTQVGGDHYIKHTIRPWDIIDEYDLGYYGGNALKYLLRDKGDRKEDLEKARHYIAKMIGDLVNANNS
tara:strand:+ start:203 stop:586 length:384 start_codon:yes stop_codon:yes gene_type:complete